MDRAEGKGLMSESIGEPIPSGGEAGKSPPWQERDAWTVLADLDEAPALVPVRDWRPASRVWTGRGAPRNPRLTSVAA